MENVAHCEFAYLRDLLIRWGSILSLIFFFQGWREGWLKQVLTLWSSSESMKFSFCLKIQIQYKWNFFKCSASALMPPLSRTLSGRENILLAELSPNSALKLLTESKVSFLMKDPKKTHLGPKSHHSTKTAPQQDFNDLLFSILGIKKKLFNVCMRKLPSWFKQINSLLLSLPVSS